MAKKSKVTQKPKLNKKPKATAGRKKSKPSGRKLTQVESLDRILLAMAARPIDKIMKQIKSSQKRLNEERRLALQVGGQILNKAKKVRDSLISAAKKT